MYGVHRNALLQAHAVNRIEHTITLLDHLSRRLENYMLQATVIIAFAVTSLSAETLEIMAQYNSAFCIWKSPQHNAIGLLFVLSTSAMKESHVLGARGLWSNQYRYTRQCSDRS